MSRSIERRTGERPEHVREDAPPESRPRPVPSVALDDGAHAVVHEGGLEIRDREGRMLVRYANGAATIEAAAGDLTLSAPNGKVAIRAGDEIVLDAPRRLSLRSDEVSVTAKAIVTTAEKIAETAGRVERTAHRLIERAREAFRDVAELQQERLGRARTIVQGAYSLSTERTTMLSKDDTSIDGKRILLG